MCNIELSAVCGEAVRGTRRLPQPAGAPQLPGEDDDDDDDDHDDDHDHDDHDYDDDEHVAVSPGVRGAAGRVGVRGY